MSVNFSKTSQVQVDSKINFSNSGSLKKKNEKLIVSINK